MAKKIKMFDDVPEVKAGDADKEVRGNHEEFDKANKELEAALKDLSAGKYATSEDLQKELKEIKAGIDSAFGKHQDSILDTIVEKITAGTDKNKEEVMASVREELATALKGRGKKETVDASMRSGWIRLEAGQQEDLSDGRKPQLRNLNARFEHVLYSDIRHPIHSIEAAAIAAPAQGSGVTAFAPYVQMVQMDAFMEYATVVYPTNPNFTMPYVGGTIAVAKNAATPIDGAAGDISDTNPTPADRFEARTWHPNTTEDDLMGWRDAVTRRHMMAVGGQWGAEVAGVMKAGTARQVTSTAASLAAETDENIIVNLSRMLELLKAVYRPGAVWMMHEALESKITRQWSDSGFGFDPVTGLRMVHGYPIRVNSHLENGAAASNVVGYIGNYAIGLAEALYRDLETRFFEQTQPGWIDAYTLLRAAAKVLDTNAFTGYRIRT